MNRARRFVLLLSAALLVVAPGVAQAAAPSDAATAPSGDASIAIRGCVDVTNRDVGYGSTGQYVKEVQCLLNFAINPNTYGYIGVDGEFGPATRAKVIFFQQCANSWGAGLAVDGRVGPRTAPYLEAWAESTEYAC